MNGPLKRRLDRLEDIRGLSRIAVIGFVPDAWTREEAETALLQEAVEYGLERPASAIPIPDDRRTGAEVHWIGDITALLNGVAEKSGRIGMASNERGKG